MKDYSKLSGEDWATLLRKRPELSIHVDWSKLNGYNWSWLLKEQLRFAKHADWSKLNGINWSWLLKDQPELSIHADWSKLDGINWVELLKDQPQFAKHADWSKLNGEDWRWLLREQPQLAKHADWSKLSGYSWRRLVKDQPQLAKYKPKNMSEASTMPKKSLLSEINETVSVIHTEMKEISAQVNEECMVVESEDGTIEYIPSKTKYVIDKDSVRSSSRNNPTISVGDVFIERDAKTKEDVTNVISNIFTDKSGKQRISYRSNDGTGLLGNPTTTIIADNKKFKFVRTMSGSTNRRVFQKIA